MARPTLDDNPTPDSLRREGAADFMGPGFLEQIEKKKLKRRAYEFWYHPYTEVAIFVLIIVSVGMLIVEISTPTTTGSGGWLGGLAAGQATGWFFWTDAAITLVFVLEYISKLWITPQGRKWFYVRNSWVELLALLPVLRFFRLFRIFRAVRIFRLLRVFRSVRLLRTSRLLANLFQNFGSDVQKNRSGNLIVLVYFVSTMLFGTVGIMVFERGAGSGFDTLADGLWWCIVTVTTVGYGDIVPVTSEGRLVASIVVMLGLGLWSLITGVVTSTFLARVHRKDALGLDLLGINGHVLICGWNSNGPRLVRDFRRHRPERHIVIISEQEDLGLRLDGRLHHVRTDPGTAEALEIAQADEAEAVVVLAERQPGQLPSDVDARSVLLCLTFRHLQCRGRLIVELLEEENRAHARDGGADEVVVAQNYGGSLLSQAVQSPGLSQVFSELFELGGGAQFREIPLPESYVELTLSQAAARLFETERACLVALQRDGETLSAGPAEPRIEPGDRAVIIAPRRKDYY